MFVNRERLISFIDHENVSLNRRRRHSVTDCNGGATEPSPGRGAAVDARRMIAGISIHRET
jgi:hypothetical protein